MEPQRSHSGATEGPQRSHRGATEEPPRRHRGATAQPQSRHRGGTEEPFWRHNGATGVALVLLRRLKEAGAEDRLWLTQFGFRSQCGTADALFLARRAIEEAHAQKQGKVILLALDLAKAFDSISPAALTKALIRFGVPNEFVAMIEAIYVNRVFVVKDAGQQSMWHEQRFGICQGCPLSPFLFVIVMSVLMADARQALEASGHTLSADLAFHDLLYADDTLLVDVHEATIQQFMDCVGLAGGEYGLTFNWSKLEALIVRTDATIRKPDGSAVAAKGAMVYLGGLLSGDGRIGPELGRRIGLAQADFRSLQRVWSHSALSHAKKLRIFETCVASRALYGLHTAWLNQSERRRLDGFHARCMRRILGIPAAFYSRISNAEVLRQAGTRALSASLLHRQLMYFAHISRRPAGSPLRDSVFEPGTVKLRSKTFERRVGRPRTAWSDAVHRIALQIAGTPAHLEEMMCSGRQQHRWRAAVSQHCYQ